MRILRISGRLIIFLMLTLLTQVGGLVYAANHLVYNPIERYFGSNIATRGIKLLSFILLYTTATFLLIPLIARPLGRVPLPLTATNNLRPLTIWTCILNRNYVRPELRDLTYHVASKLAEKHPGTIVNYLDASFPFINGFGLFPHLSHNDGKKLDLSFCYADSNTGQETNNAPSFIGYGICEEPRPGETNTAAFCCEKGYRQYSFLRKIIPQGNKINFTFNEQKTKELVELFAEESLIGKIFIEPHLKMRLSLTTKKIKFHGCRAVRHDDHLHVQLK